MSGRNLFSNTFDIDLQIIKQKKTVESSSLDSENKSPSNIFDGLVYVGGYIVNKISNIECCYNIYSTSIDHHEYQSNYIDQINRGKLKLPSVQFIELLDALLSHFLTKIMPKMSFNHIKANSDIENEFLEILFETDMYSLFFCENCKSLDICLKTFTNIILNNFTKTINDRNKRSSIERKLMKYSS